MKKLLGVLMLFVPGLVFGYWFHVQTTAAFIAALLMPIFSFVCILFSLWLLGALVRRVT
jgi:hypothetical protein